MVSGLLKQSNRIGKQESSFGSAERSMNGLLIPVDPQPDLGNWIEFIGLGDTAYIKEAKSSLVKPVRGNAIELIVDDTTLWLLGIGKRAGERAIKMHIMWCVAPVVVQIQDNNLGMMQVMVDTCKVILQFDDEHKEVGK